MTAAARIELVFYRSLSGAEPVREWLLTLHVDDRRTVGLDLQRVQYRWPVGMPLVRPMGGGLHEVRCNITGGIARIFFCLHGGEIYALHAFVKKNQKTPMADLRLARERLKEVRNG